MLFNIALLYERLLLIRTSSALSFIYSFVRSLTHPEIHVFKAPLPPANSTLQQPKAKGASIRP